MTDAPTLPRSLPDLELRVASIRESLSQFLARVPAPDYQVLPAQRFCRDDFTRPFLNEAEMHRLNAFKVLKKQVEWICGRFAAKTLARQVLMPEMPLLEITLDYRPMGAPYLTAFPGHCISLSHAKDFTAVALSTAPGITLGVDIEAIGPLPDEGFMKTAFTRKERAAMGNGPEAVFRSWTLKEAYLKYIQKGFNESLHHVEILGDRILHDKTPAAVACRSWILKEGYALGLVTTA